MGTTKRKHEEGKGIAGTAAGGTAGALAGAGIGAAVGGPVGAAIGAGIGAVTGSAAGAAIDYESHEPEFRREYETSSTKKSPKWEEISPAYRYGWETYDRPEYKGKAWSQVNTDLQNGWAGGGRWSDYEPHVKRAWERRASYHGQATER